ncbi:DUF2911 domain-containing protein [Parapedobacter lycopersici]|uniref:DUF2911 domain-containing protein n=1 Tax=Parapedobacter lycopersici TaxID=1864939 RepID=UPI0033411F84
MIMKNVNLLSLLFIAVFSLGACAQDKSSRPSPLDNTMVTTSDGVTITIQYSKPSLKGRQFGVELAPYGEVWRTGANEATTFEIDKDVQVQGQPLPAGKYSLYTIPSEQNMVVIFNKNWEQWGTDYDESADALRVTSDPTVQHDQTEQFTITADQDGKISLLWGDDQTSFTVKAAN